MPSESERGTVVVTGASRGIGAAVASDLAGRGYDVVGLSRTGQSPAGRGVSCDVGDEQALVAAIAEAAAGGPVAGLVNNAGLHSGAVASAELTVDDFESLFHTNVSSAMVASREIHPHLVENGGGTIVNIGSFFDKFGVPGNLSYTVTKAALGAMTRVHAVEWAQDGISVVNVAPGYIETNLAPDFWENEASHKWLARRVPLRRQGTSEEVARVVGAVFAEKVGFLTGETIYVDGAHGINH